MLAVTQKHDPTNMHETDLNKVVFHSKEDMAGGHNLQKGEHILRSDTKSNYTDINEILELYNLKKYFDNELYLYKEISLKIIRK